MTTKKERQKICNLTYGSILQQQKKLNSDERVTLVEEVSNTDDVQGSEESYGEERAKAKNNNK